MEAIVRWGTGAGRSSFGSRRKTARPWTRFVAWVLCLLVAATTGSASGTSYVYDANGRLIAVTNDAGESARYVYDIMGNIVQVDRIEADELALFSFTPGRGVSGTQVKLQGHGFSVDRAANVVRFGGSIASVSSASSTELIAIVPPDAVTGPISLTVGTQSVSSTTAFIVDESALAPRIDGISPMVSAAGSSVTVTGQSLYPISHQTTARIGTRAGVISSAQDTELSFVVPPTAASGKVSVTTPYGMAVSAQDLLVLPSGISTTDVASTMRLVPDAPAGSFSVQATGGQVAVLVDAALGEYLDAQFSAISVTSLAYTLYDPFNRKVTSGSVTPSSPSLLLPPANSAGTYLLLIKPVQGPATWDLSIERSKTINADGDFLPLATILNGQKRFIFSASRDQRLGLGIGEITLSTGTYMSAAVVTRDGASVASATCYTSNAGCQLNVRAPETGIYSVVLTPRATGQIMQVQATLSNDVYIGLQREAPLDLVLPRRGQNARLRFIAQAGDSLALQVVGQVTQPAGKYVNYSVYKPDGTLLSGSNVSAYQLLNLPSLPQSGEYFVFADADHGATVSSRVILMDGGNGSEIDGGLGQFATPSGGQSVYFNFDVSEADQRLGLGISDLVLSTGSYANVHVYRPDGASLVSATCYQSEGGCDLDIRAPVTGRYSVVVQPLSASQTMQFKATLSSDLRVDIQRETPLQLSIPRRGQNARVCFDAEAGETLALQVAAQATVPVDRSVNYQIIKPDGTALVQGSTTSYQTLLLPTLAAGGRYCTFIDPGKGEALDARLTLTEGRQTAMAVDGQAGDFVAPVSGHPAYLSFVTTEADQRLGLAIRDIEISAGAYFSVHVYRPDGLALTSQTCYKSQGGCELNIRAPTLGAYSIVVTPYSSSQLIRFRATLSNDQRGVLQREVPTDLIVPRFGQNSRLGFTAQAGEDLALQISGQSTVPSGHSVGYSIYKPDGSLLTSTSSTSFDSLRLINLPASGEYLIFVDPVYGATAQARMLLTAGNGDAPVVDGADGSVSTIAGGQATFTTFQVSEVDQRIGIGISDLVLSSGTYASVYVYRPNGGSVASSNCSQSQQGCELNVRAPEVGTYGVVVVPQNATQTMSYKIAVSNDMRMTLPRETPFTLSVPRRGQNARLTFAAQAGETLAFQIAGQATVPVEKNVNYQVYKPDGTLLVGGYASDYNTLNMPNLPASGEYMVFIDPSYGATVNSQLVLSSGEGSGTVIDGAPGELLTTQPGQSSYLTFHANAGQLLGLGISDLSLSSGTSVNVYVYRPGGASAASTNCAVSMGGCALNVSAVDTGTYSVVVTPQSASQTMRFKATLSQDFAATLERNVPLDLAISRRGQNARLNFSGQAGEALALQVAGQSTFPAARSVYYRVYKPDGSQLGSFGTSDLGALDLRLPVTGVYQVLAESNYGETFGARVTLSTGEVQQVDGSPTEQQTTFGGQPAYATFQAIAGQRLGIGVYDLALSSGTWVGVGVYRPNGSSAVSTSCHQTNQGCKLSLMAAETGTYSIVFTPNAANQTMAFKIAVSQDLTGALQRNVPLDLVLQRRGQNARLTFTGQAGEWLSLQMAGQATIPANRTVYYRVYRPDGSQLSSGSTSSFGAANLPSLPLTGEYTVLVDSGLGEATSVRLTLASGASALQVDGASATVLTSFGGQSAFLTFEATAGQRLGVGLSDLEVSTDSYFSAVLYRPDGNIASSSCFPQQGGCEMNSTANATGTYRMYMTPQTSSQKIAFKATVSTDVAATLQRGSRLQLELLRQGQNGWLTFSGVAGESLTLQIANQSSLPAGGSVYYVIYKPDGVALTSLNDAAAGRTWQLPSLPVTGDYHVMVSPNYGARLSVDLTLQ